MFPIKDENPTILNPVVTIGIIVVNVVVWLLVQQMGAEPGLSQSVCQLGLIPGEFLHRIPPGTQVPMGPDVTCELSGGATWYTPLTSMFMHGGWLHLIGNMWFLWIFGDNVEDAMGHVRFVVFYLLCGLAAAGAQMLSAPSSIVPMVGASGAIGGVMGAYALLYPRAHVHMFIFLGFYMTTIAVPAIYMLGYWFLLQLLSGLPGLSGGRPGGVAFWAHVGGFLAGLAMVTLFKQRERLEARLGRPARRTAKHRWF